MPKNFKPIIMQILKDIKNHDPNYLTPKEIEAAIVNKNLNIGKKTIHKSIIALWKENPNIWYGGIKLQENSFVFSNVYYYCDNKKESWEENKRQVDQRPQNERIKGGIKFEKGVPQFSFPTIKRSNRIPKSFQKI